MRLQMVRPWYRMDSGHKASQVPIGTLLGCTWNPELNEKLFHLVGKEMQANHIDTLLGLGLTSTATL
ncbi:hypothetical protein OH492_08105 [Vibrio chagasii]|nr:hypothetical protein [Vibrio chagasii]